MTGVAVAVGLVVAALGLARATRIGLERELAIAAIRAGVQLAAVGALVALVFAHAGLAWGFMALMLGAAAVTSGRRLAGTPHATARAAAAIATGAASALVPLLLTGAFTTRPREIVPVAGILIGGAMAATSVTGRRLIERAAEDRAGIEARLALGASVPDALAPSARQAVTTAMIPILDQTKNVGLVTLPGTFVGLVLGGASPAEAARVQLIVLLSLLAVELVAGLAAARLTVAGLRAPGERVLIRP